MNFTEQEKYLKRARVWAAVVVGALILVAGGFWSISGIFARVPVIAFGISVAGLSGSLFYTPDYLNLSVNVTKRSRWQIKIRWRLIAFGLIIGLITASSARSALIVCAVCASFAAANLIAKTRVRPNYSTAYFWLTDCAILAALFLDPQMNFLGAITLLMGAVHLTIVACYERLIPWIGVVTITFFLVLQVARVTEQVGWNNFVLGGAVILLSEQAAVILVLMARMQNHNNVGAATRALEEFTDYSREQIRGLWATSNEQLAKNWKDAHLDESDREKMTAWYRENSELYMFAISGYNLEYKRIRDSIRMLKYGRGACLDYGAGNGEIILELARRGHAAIYFDVDGTSMRFARHRAERQKLAVEFFHSKEDLAAAAQKCGLDTIFSFDVLEHLPDLPGELKFLASLLNPGGRMAFDVPAGSTKSHPMHLSHHLDIHAHMASIGMVEEHSWLQSIPFRKQEKYVFRKPA